MNTTAEPLRTEQLNEADWYISRVTLEEKKKKVLKNVDTFAPSLFRVALGALFPLHTNGFDGLCEMFLSSFLLSVSYPRPVFVFSSPRSLSPLVVHLSLMPASAAAVPLCDFSCPYGNELRHLVSYVVSFAVEPSSIYSSVYRPFPYSRRKPLPNLLVVVGIH